MIKLTKINNGLINQNIGEGNVFLDTNRFFTSTQFETGLSYFLFNDKDILLELDNNVLFFELKNLSIDEQIFENHNELINYLFNNV
jgi:hypothetical protein